MADVLFVGEAHAGLLIGLHKMHQRFQPMPVDKIIRVQVFEIFPPGMAGRPVPVWIIPEILLIDMDLDPAVPVGIALRDADRCIR